MAVHECFINKSEYFWNLFRFVGVELFYFPDVHQPQTSSSSSLFMYTRNRIILHGLPRNRV